MKTARFITFTALVSLLSVVGACSSDNVPDPTVHVHAADGAGIFVNAYLVETENGVVAIDAMLTVSDAMELRANLDAIGKPLLAVLITHGHPDHYNGVTELVRGLDAPIVATQGVDDIIRRDDASKEAQWKPIFGDEWPDMRTFPNQIVAPGDTVEFDGVPFTIGELGPGESHFDTYWIMEAGNHAVFVGDVVFNEVHSYMSDGHSAEWLANLDILDAAIADVETVYPGHGTAGGTDMLDDQRQYIQLYRDTVAELAQGQPSLTEDAKASLTETMKAYLPTDKLEFLIALGGDPIAAELAAE